MFISQLKDKLLAYDKYGEHRVNGAKALFALQVMMVFYYCSSMQNPYFYFFYAPLTCFTAEITGNTIEEKYLFLFCTLVGAAISIFFFNVFNVYKTFFVFFVFFFTLSLYYIVHKKLNNMLVVVPLILSVSSYSLTYATPENSNFYVALNHALEILAALLMMLIALLLFPQKCYFFMWRRAFIEVIETLEAFCARIIQEEIKTLPISSATIAMARYAKMIPRWMKYYTVVRVTMLAFELVQGMSYILSFQKQMHMDYVRVLHQYLAHLSQACKKHQPFLLTPHDVLACNQTHELRVIYKLILSWNYLCAHH